VQFIAVQPAPPRKILVAYTEPDPRRMAPANLARGAGVLSVDGVTRSTQYSGGRRHINAA